VLGDTSAGETEEVLPGKTQALAKAGTTGWWEKGKKGDSGESMNCGRD